jgi:hypothetical protein
MLTLACKKSRSAFPYRKAPEGWRTPKRFTYFRNQRIAHGVLDCGGPPPLFPRPHPIVPILPQLPWNMPLLMELFILFGLNYKDVAPTALNAAFFGFKNTLARNLNAK